MIIFPHVKNVYLYLSRNYILMNVKTIFGKNYFWFHLALGLAIISLLCGSSSVVYAQTQLGDSVSGITALFVAVGSVMGAVAAIATSIIGIIKSKTGDKLISDKSYGDISMVASSLKETDYWILENQKNIGDIISAISTLSPDAKNALEEKGVNIQSWTQQISSISDELARVHSMLPGSTSRLTPP